jgi:hypothetical protein
MKPKCAQCGKPLPAVCIQHSDPYCSTTCARIAHDAVGK